MAFLGSLQCSSDNQSSVYGRNYNITDMINLYKSSGKLALSWIIGLISDNISKIKILGTDLNCMNRLIACHHIDQSLCNINGAPC